MPKADPPLHVVVPKLHGRVISIPVPAIGERTTLLFFPHDTDEYFTTGLLGAGIGLAQSRYIVRVIS